MKAREVDLVTVHLSVERDKDSIDSILSLRLGKGVGLNPQRKSGTKLHCDMQ